MGASIRKIMVKKRRNLKVDEESLKETIDILSYPEALRDIAEALNEFEQGKFVELR